MPFFTVDRKRIKESDQKKSGAGKHQTSRGFAEQDEKAACFAEMSRVQAVIPARDAKPRMRNQSSVNMKRPEFCFTPVSKFRLIGQLPLR